MPFDTFISYSSKDKPAADAACAALEAAGVRCWIAPRDIRPGREYAAGIMDGIDACRTVVVIFSTNANASVQIHREIERAVSKGLTIVPLRIEAALPTAAMEFYLGSIHWLDALTPPMERHLQKLVETVKAILQIDAPQRPASAGGAPPAHAGATVTGDGGELPSGKPGEAPPAAAVQAKPARPPVVMLALVLAGVLVVGVAGGLWLSQTRSPAVTVTPPPTDSATTVPPPPPKPAESSPLYKEVKTMLQPQILDANGKITVEASIIHIINCNQPGNREFWIYEYVNRAGFRAVLPPNWGVSIGGGDYTTFAAAAGAACRS